MFDRYQPSSAARPAGRTRALTSSHHRSRRSTYLRGHSELARHQFLWYFVHVEGEPIQLPAVQRQQVVSVQARVLQTCVAAKTHSVRHGHSASHHKSTVRNDSTARRTRWFVHNRFLLRCYEQMRPRLLKKVTHYGVKTRVNGATDLIQ